MKLLYHSKFTQIWSFVNTTAILLSLLLLFQISECQKAELCNDENCLNGRCENDLCTCNNCFSGTKCEQKDNTRPLFEQSTYQITVLNSVNKSNVLITVKAMDDDVCNDNDTCPCTAINYSFLENPNEMFEINSTSGQIKINRKNTFSTIGGQYYLTVKASNLDPFNDNYDTAAVIITFTGRQEKQQRQLSMNETYHLLRRQKRAVTAPPKLEFVLSQTYPTTTLTTIEVGQRLTFEIKIRFPTTAQSLTVEIFAPEESTKAIMTICNVNLKSVGGELDVPTTPTPTKHGIGSAVWPYVRIVYQLTNIKAKVASPATFNDIEMVIEFETVMQYVPTVTTLPKTYYVSSGAEYLNGNEIWVGQASYSYATAPTEPTPVFKFTGDADLYPDSTAVYDLVIEASQAYIGLDIEFFAPLNNTAILSFCYIKRTFVGDSYSCIPDDQGVPQLSSVISSGKKLNYKGTMTLGFISNKNFKDPLVDTLKQSIKIKMALRTNPSAWLGQYFDFGYSAVHVHNKIKSEKKTLIVKSKPALTAYGSAIVHSVDYFNSVSTISLNNFQKLVIKITVPSSTELDYTINVKAADDKLAICGIKMHKAGLNVPCLDQIEPKVTSAFNTNGVVNEKTFVFKNIRHVPLKTEAVENELEFHVYVRAVTGAASDVASVATTVSWTGGTGTAVSKSLTLTSASTPTTIPTADLPTFTFQLNPTGTGNSIWYDDKLSAILTITLKPNIAYSSNSIEFFLPLKNNVALMELCSAEIISVGKNVDCLDKAFYNKKIIYTDRGVTNAVKNKAEIKLGSLRASSASTTGGEDEKIVILFKFTVLNDATNNPLNAVNKINAGMFITASEIWVGSISVTTTTRDISAVKNHKPLLFGGRIDASNYEVFKRDIVALEYLIKLQPTKYYDLSLKIFTDITTEDDFGVCFIRVKKMGSNLPCIEPTVTDVKWSPYSKMSKEMTINFPAFLHSGTGTVSDSNVYDDNSILLEVYVKYGPNVPASSKVQALLTSNADTVPKDLTFTLSSTTVRINGTVTGTQPEFAMVTYSLFNDSQVSLTKLAYGEAARGMITVKLKKKSMQLLKISFSSKTETTNQMDVVSVNIFKVGRNIPCFKPGQFIFTSQKRTNSLSLDMTSLDLGTVCQKDMVTENVVDDDDKIYIEAIFVVWNTPKDNPTTLDLNGLALLNNDEVHITKLTFTATSDPAHVTPISYSTVPASVTITPINPIVIKVGAVQDFDFKVNIPYNSQYKSAKLHILPLVEVNTAYLVCEACKVIIKSSGIHIGINVADTIPFETSSSVSTSQTDTIIINLGVLQNVGTKYNLYQLNYTTFDASDDLVIGLQLRLADHPNGNQDKIVTLTTKLELDGTMTDHTFTIKIDRTGVTAFEIVTKTELLSTLAQYRATEEMEISALATLSNLTMLECRDFLIIAAMPSFIKLKTVKLTNYTSPGFTVTNTNVKNVVFKAPYFFFKEQLHVVFTVAMDADTTLSNQRQEAVATIPIIYTCKKAFPPSPWVNKVDDVVVNLRGKDISISTCNDDLKVTDNTIIKDCQIRSFLDPYTGNDRLKIRSNSGSYWKPHTRPGHFGRFRYIDILFGSLRRVTKVKITCSLTNKPTELQIYGTMDGRSFALYKTLAISFVASEASILLTIPDFIYRGIRVSISKTANDNLETGINIDLVGCTPSYTDNNPFDPCTVNSNMLPQTMLADYYKRGYLFVDPHLFLCDEAPLDSTSIHVKPRCYRTETTTPTVWQDMGPTVGKIIGYNLEKKHLFGISSDLTGYIMSEDDGLTWVGTNAEGWKMAKVLDSLASHVEVPWTVSADFSSTTNCGKYLAGTWKFCYDGVYIGATKHLSWNDCCSL